MKHNRKAAVSGYFYPDNPTTLKSSIVNYLSLSQRESSDTVRMLIVPHAGYTYSGKIAAESYSEITTDNFNHIILLGPSHRYSFKGVCGTDVKNWESPLGMIKIKSLNDKGITINSDYHANEHSLEVQIPFLKFLLPEAVLTPLLLSGPCNLAQKIANQLISLDAEDVLWVISSDFNHVGPNFHYYPDDHNFESGEKLDFLALKHIVSGNINDFQSYLSQYSATICGALPILVGMYLREKIGLPNFTLKNYDCSGNQTNDINSVGYGSLYC